MESGIWEILLAESKILGFRIWNTAQGILNPTNNRPLPSSTNPHFQNEARCTTFLVKMSFICMRMKNDFHIKGWAPTLVLKQRPGGTLKWPIGVRNPSSTDKESRIQHLESAIHSMESRVQDCLGFPYMTWESLSIEITIYADIIRVISVKFLLVISLLYKTEWSWELTSHKNESNWYFNKFSPPLLLKTYRENKGEFEFWCYGLQG